ncbi:hypothetical protein SDC9_186933 [bioreactor metagenome]|uniref:Uncharacterized protein n=1 Tax=bioreactor metagenome TaxID=1076179 RepID=A0A645HK65_9ZZZZ
MVIVGPNRYLHPARDHFSLTDGRWRRLQFVVSRIKEDVTLERFVMQPVFTHKIVKIHPVRHDATIDITCIGNRNTCQFLVGFSIE